MLVFWCCSEIFCRFWARFCINHYNDLQNSMHEKRLENDVSSLRNPVIMRVIKLRFPFGDRCSTNWAIPLNIKLLHSDINSLQEIYYHRHAILSSIFQHKNANLNKNSVFHVRDARQLHFIIRDITCRIACLCTWMTWFLTTAQPFFQSWKPNVIIRRLRCGWIYVQKNVYLTRGKGHSKGACRLSEKEKYSWQKKN